MNVRRELQKELAGLIVSNQIAARIDSDAGALYSHHTDQRAATYHSTLKTGAAGCIECISCASIAVQGRIATRDIPQGRRAL
jgi:hypothetical protein